MRMIFSIILFCGTFVQLSNALENIHCSLPSAVQLIAQGIPRTFEFNVPYTVILASNDTSLLSYLTLDIESVNPFTNLSNDSSCRPTNQTASSYIYNIELILKLEKNSTETKCVRLILNTRATSTPMQLADLCTNDNTDKVVDNDDKYDVQSYLRTINTTEIALQDNFNWLIFGPRVQQIWYTHEGMRLSRECDAADDGRVALFNNLRGKRRLISRPIAITNASLLYMRLGSGTCPPPAPTDPPFQLLVTSDCLNYSKWHVVHSQRILPGIEHVTVPFALKNITNSSSVCLKIEQNGDKFAGGGSWFIDDLLIIRSRLQQEYLFEKFQTMRPANWHRLVGGQLKTCDGQMSMLFESNSDIRTELGATTIDISLSGILDYKRDVLFHLSKNISIDWTKWNATGYLDLNKTCTNDDVITFNGESYRQLCSPNIELGQIDSVRFTLSTEPCTKRNKYIPAPDAGIFLSIYYNGSTMGYSRTIHRITLRELQQMPKTFDIRFDEVRRSANTFGRICLSQYHQSFGQNVDVWSVRDFVALPLLQTNITHYIQLGLNTKCSSSPQQSTNGAGGTTSESVNIEYSVDFGKKWHSLLQPCFLDSACSRQVQHVYTSKIILSSSGWNRVTLPLPMATLQQKYIRFRISTLPDVLSAHSISSAWAIDQVFIGQCSEGCHGHGWCEYNSCRCDSGFSGDSCEFSNTTLFDRQTFSFDNNHNQTDLITSYSYAGGRSSYQCDIISQGKALVFSKAGFRFLRVTNINGSSPKLLEFTLRLGGANTQCLGSSSTDLDRYLKSILLLSSCSNGVHWTIVDLFGISDIRAPNFGAISRVLFEKKMASDNCLIEWRQMIHSGDNRDVWAIDDITIRDTISSKLTKRNLQTKTFQTKLTYIRPGYILSFRLESINKKASKLSYNLHDIRLRINSSQIDLSENVDIFSYQSENSSLTVIITLPQKLWYTHLILNLTLVATKTLDLNFVHLGVQCENNCWANGVCFEGMCLEEQSRKISRPAMNVSLNEEDLIKHKINAIDDEVLLPLIESTDLTGVHFQTAARLKIKNKLRFQCSSNGGVTWFELGRWKEEKETSLKDHYVSLPSSCRAKHTFFRWQNSSIRIFNIAFVHSHPQDHFMDQFQRMDSSKWLYPTYSINSSGLYPKQIRLDSGNQTLFQLISTTITLKEHDYVLMIDTNAATNHSNLQIDYSLDNLTWHELFETKSFLPRLKHRFGQQLPKEVLQRSILIRLQSDRLFALTHVYIGPSCPANCYGHGKCLWQEQQAICQCDKNQSSATNCLPERLLLSSISETFETKLNTSLWSISSDHKITHRCYNLQSITTAYLCFEPTKQTQQSYAMIGPFPSIRYVIFKFGLRYTNTSHCSNRILFQYSYDNGIQWHTKKMLDETTHLFESFEDLLINRHIHLRWIKETTDSCLMWNLRSISIRTKNDENLWFENNLNRDQKTAIHYEAQTWEFPAIQSSSMLQFDLQMFPIKKTNETNWSVALEISSDVSNGWNNWIPLIPSCNQTDFYCEDRIALTGSIFLAQLYGRAKNVTIPIPENYVNQEVRVRWIANQPNARFVIEHVYVGADCPWFCSGHGLCQSNGCLCHHGYVLPYCSPDPSMALSEPQIKLDANLSTWSESWGNEKCSSDDDRYVFSKAGTRALISPELSLVGIKFLRIQLDTCFNRTEIFLDPIHIQISLNNAILWKTLTTITYREEWPTKPWLIELSKDDVIPHYFVRLRLFQRVTTKWTSNWILNQFEMIPEKLPDRWLSNRSSLAMTCNYQNAVFPLEIYSTPDIQLNETSFLTFQIESNPCTVNSSSTTNRSQFDLQYSHDYGQTWSTIDRPSTIASDSNDIIVSQPLLAIKEIFHLPLYPYLSLTRFLRIRWLAQNVTIALEWRVTNVTVRSECEVLCEVQECNGKCRCSTKTSCSSSPTETTYSQRFNRSFILSSNQLVLPVLNLASTRFIEMTLRLNCKDNVQLFSLEYSRNMGLSWHLMKYYIFKSNRPTRIHEDFLDEMRYNFMLIRLIFLSDNVQCLKIEQIVVSGSIHLPEIIYRQFNQLNNINQKSFVSLGDAINNGTYLIFPTKRTSSTPTDQVHELITEDVNIFENTFYIQLPLLPLSYNCCLSVLFSFSSDYGYNWQSMDRDDVLLFEEKQYYRQPKIFTWKFTSTMIGSNQVRFRIRFEEKQCLIDQEQSLLGISEFYLGSHCLNGCHNHGMCLPNGQCRCNPGWKKDDCSVSVIGFPHEIDILKHGYYDTFGSVHETKCGRIYNHTCKRELQTNYLDVNHEYTYVHIQLNDQCKSQIHLRKNGEGWIRLQYRQVNSYQWITLHIFRGYDLSVTKLLPRSILRLRLIEDPPLLNQFVWSVEQFQVFRIHSTLQWSFVTNQTSWNSTLLSIREQKEDIYSETKDVGYQADYIFQVEYHCPNISDPLLEYSFDLGSTWFAIPNEDDLQFTPIRSSNSSRLTIPLRLLSMKNTSIRFRMKFSSKCPSNHLRYVYLGKECPMNCFGHSRCVNGECQTTKSLLPLVDFRDTFDTDSRDTNWLQLEPYRQETNRLLWTTTSREAITQPIDLRSTRALKWTYYLEDTSKTCSVPIYLLVSTDGTLTWAVVHRFDLPMKNLSTSNTSVELESGNFDYRLGQFRWYQSVSPKCQNLTWGLSKIISIKSINQYFLTDYFYSISSSRSNWESIDGALLGQADPCNNNLPAFIFQDTAFAVATVPILVQSFYVLVFQFNTDCNQNLKTEKILCRNITSVIEYRKESTGKWTQLIDMADLACRTSLLNGGYFNMHTIKLPAATYSR